MKNPVTDKVGKNTLDVVGEADLFNKWMFQTIYPFSTGKILEIGSGLGNISEFFINNEDEIMLTDLREEYCLSLQHKFGSKQNLLGIDKLNLIHPEFEQAYSNHLEKYDTVFALNVIEHIEDDDLAISNCKKLLRKGGHLIILVPSYQKLYNRFDKELGHFRRYTIETLSDLFEKNGIEIIHKKYFNFIGVFGWYISGGLLKKDTIPSSQMRIYNKLVPLWKRVDRLLKNRIGLSTIVVGRK
ncbi:class I SAM-dependent methyltransferase [Salegentibacter sp. JZCK2]|uniref:class I SAM-dependent methyltransferase n=1 Tax=Salegentibacter tibetensis TaxID=2873600 RepID=UPI001CC95478|nr:class I SAM-dependent methyltransferase [Salegentibacter tibetensis]MBZ9729733.1 class I SAM-dependent methyltransferase [Salegentibacter tibetensis]